MVNHKYQTAFKLYPYQRSNDQDSADIIRHPVIIVGGGPVGMGLALDLGLKNIPVVVLDDHDGVGKGSRAICFSKRTLEITDRLGAGQTMVDKGVIWSKGRIYRKEEEIYNFSLLPEEGHKQPAFINLQQPYFEKYLVDEIRAQQKKGAPIDIRGKNCVTEITQNSDHVLLNIDTPEGSYKLQTNWLIAADGANSPLRKMMGLGFEGRVFKDNFLIADIKMKTEFPIERHFWFNPPFNPNETALMHKQPDDIWRLDFQLGWDIDRREELKDENIRKRIRAMLGADIDFELEWTSIYTFRCCTIEKYRHGRIFFVGDAAHQVSPFGARGANGGMQDIDNLGWKLAFVVDGNAYESLLDSYHDERKFAALENIMNSSQTADFLTPRFPAHEIFRDAVLELSKSCAFARPMVNSGRLSVPAIYDTSSLNGADCDDLPKRTRPGSALTDAPTNKGWLSEQIRGQFQILAINCDFSDINFGNLTVHVTSVSTDSFSFLADRYLKNEKSAVYLIRPDQHIAARWIKPTVSQVMAALSTAIGVLHE